MRPRVFVDSSALIAHYHDRDALHSDAFRILQDLRTEGRILCSSRDVFAETITLIRRWGGYALARRAGEELRASKEVRLLPVLETDQDAAWDLFLEIRLPGLSFTDCTTAAIMRRIGISEIFSFDSDFDLLGLTTIPGKPLLKRGVGKKKRFTFARRRNPL